MIREFTLDEERIVAALAQEFQAAQWIVAPAVRRALPCGVERAARAVEALRFDATRDQCLSAIRAVVGE